MQELALAGAGDEEIGPAVSVEVANGDAARQDLADGHRGWMRIALILPVQREARAFGPLGKHGAAGAKPLAVEELHPNEAPLAWLVLLHLGADVPLLWDARACRFLGAEPEVEIGGWRGASHPRP